MPFKIKARVYGLGKKLNELIPELEKRGFNVSPSDISDAIAGRRRSKKFVDILSAANEIVTEWEKEASSDYIDINYRCNDRLI